MNRFVLLLVFYCLGTFAWGQSKSEIILTRANALYPKNYNASFDLCCQAEKINDIRFIGEVSICKARYYLTFTDYENAEIELSKAISFYDKQGDLKNLSYAYDLKSILLDRLGDSTSSTYYLLKAYTISKKSGDISAQTKRLINLTNNLNEKGDLKASLQYLNELESKIDDTNSSDAFYFHQNKGEYYFRKKEVDKAIASYLQAYKLANYNKLIDSKATILMFLSQAYRYKKQFDIAQQQALKSYEISEENQLIYEKSEALQELIELSSITKNFTEAFRLQKELIEVNNEILNTEKLNRISAIQNRLVLAEKENIITRQKTKITEEKLKITKSELRNQKLYILITVVLVIFLFVLLTYIRTKKLNATIHQQKNEVEEKKILVETQNKDIKDSIRYAERIQQAILPPSELWYSKLPSSFVYYSPKDILSGDFYWIEENKDNIYVAAADCTGHGVPGALISIVNYNLLNKAMLERRLTAPGAILDAVNNWLTESLHQSFNNSTVKDGMDISLISIAKEGNKIEFAGAFSTLYHIQGQQLTEIKGDKFPVGAFIHEERSNFKTHQLYYEQGDRLYLFTDGYADQFGGPKDKKFKYSQLKTTLLEMQDLPMELQQKQLEKIFLAWKGHNEQVDDVLIIGIEL